MLVVIKTKEELYRFIKIYKSKQKMRLKFNNCIFQSHKKRRKDAHMACIKDEIRMVMKNAINN